MYPIVSLALLTTLAALTQGQRITTIQLEGVQYFVSRMNPYSPELNWFLAYQYCRSIGLQLASFETKEKADYFMEYLRNAGYSKYDFWTSGNRLGTDMFLWMSTGLPFNVTFNYMKGDQDSDPLSTSLTHGPQPITRKKRGDSGASNGCVAMKKPELEWDTDDCTAVKDFICEQTRCYYYNYGSIPVSTAQGRSQKMRKSSVPPFSSSSYASSAATGTTPPYSTPRKTPVTTPRREFISSTSSEASSTTEQEEHTARVQPQVQHEEHAVRIQEDPKQQQVQHEEPQVSNEAEAHASEIQHEEVQHVPKVHEENQEDYHYTTSESGEEYNTNAEPEQTTPGVSEETNELQIIRDSSRGMTHDMGEAFPWPWARNIMLEKPKPRTLSPELEK
nr:PREDICTED: uncharacterized protein LOC109038300 [Bemisia tabaci]